MLKAADLARREPLRIERQRRGLKGWHAHRNTYHSVLFEFKLYDTFHSLGTDAFFVGQPLVVDKFHEAAGAVSALFYFSAVGVENTIFEVGFARFGRFHDQNLVGADSEMPIGQESQLLGS